ncbi:HAD-superfamily hydrolase, subfamily IA, variant 1 [Natrinema altunense JCM 12890]|uniref:HAD-superfamily hydrolase, subfamily IA, variant 1 n=1 Tax=Natrinema altunense (strain JCM 12890 / CGMCC 1.3731 / AJ2) TaxID=1227494 RepID=L9ZIC6_NATA2|nr:HAD-superfamily hydrolase, subfamily IA, variant 1 [Natrinema altunense JCM 12890]
MTEVPILLPLVSAAVTEYDAVVYDLDGTLVDLDVDWNAVAVDVRAVYDNANVEPPSDGLWDMLEAADEVGLAAEVESAIATHEHDGARTSRRLVRADELLERSPPAGVCSLNCERACRIALEEHALTMAVDAVVGRDTVATWKPDPEPLLATVRELEAEPERALFVGDSARDRRTAERAGTDFEYVGDGPSGV